MKGAAPREFSEADATRNDYARWGGPLAQTEMVLRQKHALSRSSKDNSTTERTACGKQTGKWEN
ncbi:MAG: hypothetical protein HN627_01515 [Opitutae bacterium]|nr:hypothetical protein [Opitutae bacterium]